MTTKHVIDTHALLWFLGGDPRLGSKAKAVLQDPASQLILPAIALAEACWVLQKSRTKISAMQLLEVIDSDPRIVLYPLDRAVIQRSLRLSGIHEMHDRQIVSTALVLADQGHRVHLLTRDKEILSSRLVSPIW